MNKHIQNILTIVLTLIIINSEGVLYAYNKQTFHDNTPLLSVSYYDMEGNEVERHSRNHSGGMEHEKKTYSFTTQPLTIERVHTSAEGDTLVSRRIEYHYDNADRLTSITHQVNDHPETTISQVSYDAIGRRHTVTTGALTTTYSHDIHGWLSKMENSRFVQELLYTTGATPCYNGNISSMLWRGADGITRRYDYSYDGMSRLIDACYSESGRTAIPGLTIQGTPDYSTSYSYDLNGNPTQIYRKGIAHKYASGSNRQWQYDEIDNLYIDYRGNQVNFTDDSCPWGYYENAPGYIEESNDDNEYTWDANGNMTKDLNRGITSIQYNLQNMPTRIVYNDLHYEGRTYNSAGQKLRTVHTVFVTSSTSSSTSTTTLVIENKRDYYGEDLVYRNDTLEMVLTDNGYVDASGNYHYYILDYQGNVRQVADAQGEVLEQNDYYPYGGLFGESASRQNYKYSGKELETMNGLNTYDFHARPYYYPTLQFHSPDFFSEKYYHVSPYLYCLGNPIKYTDPTGNEPCDPIENPQIRRNRASNLFGKDIRMSSNGQKRSHQGFDYYAPIGTPVKSVKNGIVYNVQNNEKQGGAYGKSVTIEHIDKDGNKIYTFYAHLSEITVHKGLIVKEGETIGKSGNSGNANNMNEKDQHLHFELRTQPESKKGLDGKKNPNIIVDTKFESQDPNAEYQNQQGVVKTTPDGKKVNMNIDLK